MTSDPRLCLCGNEIPFAKCCEPILHDPSLALTPEALMRSRYTAYVMKNEQHLLKTWAPETRPGSLDLGQHRVKWLSLAVHGETIDPNDSSKGEVDFTATFLEADQLCVLRENSKFRQEAGCWYYIDGKNELSKTKIGRNSPCPCGSGRKFKRCCLRP